MKLIMSKILKTITLITIILTSSAALFGQTLSSLRYNHAVSGAYSKGELLSDKSEAEYIEYTDGFFEDFSTYHGTVFPRNDRWEDDYAFINSTWADSMISLGVATLDAYDQKGYPYYSADSGFVNSDTLTSLPFHFTGTPPDTLFFSFYYEAGGKGDLPEGIVSDIPDVAGEDALMVDFYDPATAAWVQKYYTIDNTLPHQFTRVEIPLSDTFRVDGFRFRFRNYTSLQSDIQQGTDMGQFGNADMWHIDYIRLQEEESDPDPRQLGDIAVTRNLLPSLTEYTAVPWHHFSLAQSAVERRDIPFTVQDFGAKDTSHSFQRKYQTYNLNTGAIIRNPESLTNFIDPFDAFSFTDDFTTGFYYNQADTIGRLKILAFIETNLVQPRENDTVIRKETYYDQYAYDDGTAEAAFGIDGEYQDLNKIALRFRAFRKSDNPDYLRAVLIYFAKSVDSVSANANYSIEIRKNQGAKPADEVLYISDYYSPDYSTGINEFTRIELDPPVAISDTFFVIIHQVDGYLNIGYDFNTNSLNSLYTYINHDWHNPSSLTKGSLMVRASFGTSSLPNATDPVTGENDLILYPNPVGDELFISLPGDDTEPGLVQVFSATGSMVFSEQTAGNSIRVSGLNKGIYILSFTASDGGYRYVSKFIKD